MGYPILQEQDYLKLTDGASLVKRTRTKIRLLLSQDGKIIKHIYKRKLLSSSTLWPYATRFIKNAQYLQSKNILVPEIRAVYFYPKLNCDILIYDYVDGRTLYDVARDRDLSFFPQFVEYVAQLHKLGIYFQDIHLDNIVVNNNIFTLLDLESIQIKRRSLSKSLRARNLVHLFNKKEDIPFYNQFGLENFLNQYFDLACLSEPLRRKITHYLCSRVPKDIAPLNNYDILYSNI
ncbi:MAG: hypothetical protein K2X50_03740 [Gammaproteobacteria bacterium]|nr:hypothetical protein [Gammaproteobacteria bacterium]